MSYDDSSVLRYTCDVGRGPAAGTLEDLGLRGRSGDVGSGGRTTTTSSSALSGFTQIGRCFFDSALARSYTLDCDGRLVVAGGKDGRFACFAAAELLHGSGEQEEDIGPLMSCKLHRGWISDLRLIRQAQDCGSCVMLSASNDGAVCVWDLNREHRGQPQALHEAATLHAGGVFSLDVTPEPAGQPLVLTTSKDGSAVLAQLLPGGGLERLHVFEDLHGGDVVKCGRWRDGNVAATSGNDCGVAVLDARSRSVGIRIQGAHASVTNFVEWSPCNPDLLVSFANDPAVKLWDLRSPGEPLFSFQGHAATPRRVLSDRCHSRCIAAHVGPHHPDPQALPDVPRGLCGRRQLPGSARGEVAASIALLAVHGQGSESRGHRVRPEHTVEQCVSRLVGCPTCHLQADRSAEAQV